MKLIAILAGILLISGCTSSTPIPEGSYGMILSFGDIKTFVTGPTELRSKPLLDKVIIVEIAQESSLEALDGPVRYQVTDPIQYYIATRGSLSLDEVFGQHLRILEDQGRAQNRENLIANIERLNLPVRFEDND